MSRAVLTLAAISLLCLVGASVLGFIDANNERLRLYHFLFGLFTALLTTFIHCMVMFYFIGTAKPIREAAAELKATERDYARETRRLAAIVHPLATLAIAVTIVATLLGGAVKAELLPAWAHLVGAVVALGLNAWVFRAQHRAARVNSGLIEELEAIYARKAGAAAP